MFKSRYLPDTGLHFAALGWPDPIPVPGGYAFFKKKDPIPIPVGMFKS